MADKSPHARASISLPKGGGAIRGIGETFQPNLFSGTGNFSVPIFTSPGRNGFGPTLTLQYSTGNGNGPFGLGWQLSIPRVTRKTEKGLPTYTEDDVFVMSGAEDLVPHLRQVTNEPPRWEHLFEERGDYVISVYRPRTEGQFVRIEKWVHRNGEVHWRAITPQNVTSIYGRTPRARTAEQGRADHVFEWLLEETFDARGNHILYEYVQEDPALILPGLHEQNRSYTQAYIRRILYCNTPEALEADRRAGPVRTTTDHRNALGTRERHYVFEVIFDYGDLSRPPAIPTELPDNAVGLIPSDWPVRPDPFSTFRGGFEVRTLRRCERVLMLHHFYEPGVSGAPLVKSTDFTYVVETHSRLSFLSSVTVWGYRRDPDDAKKYLERSLPPVTFGYSLFEPHKQRYQSVTVERGDLPTHALNAPEFTLMDVFGDGLPDILQAGDASFYYWQNVGEGRLQPRRPQQGGQPPVSLAQTNVAVADMGGDGLADLVVDAPPISGFYESTPDGRWSGFKRFDVAPSFDLSDPNTRLVDLTGDGLSDVLVTRDQHFLWYRCWGEAGYDSPRSIPRLHDLATFPDVYFDDPAGRVRLADMSGDGLNDIVLVHDGRIDYWPNLGYGKFGRRLTMANSPRIGYGFDPKRLFLADLDGTGCADLVYVDVDRVHFWFNQSGNAWSDRQTVHGTPPVTDLTAIQFTDFYGTGTTALLWSYDYAQQPGGNYKVLDFCGRRKPHLLVEMDNSMGATTRVEYAPSTKFYLEDAASGTPWITNLPFPVQVLENTEVIDHISRTKLVTTYRYHHGYYDGREREFRGFGRVDQFDTESFFEFASAGLHGSEALFENARLDFHVPPVETRTWFHTGVHFDPERDIDHRQLTARYREEFYRGDLEAFSLDDHVFEHTASEGQGDPPHEAYRALRGAILRTEAYGRDDSEKARHPYSVTENRYRVKGLQPIDGNQHGVHLTMLEESLAFHYERNPADPRIVGSITLGADDYGNVTDHVSIAYPRRVVPQDLPEQADTKVVYTRTDFVNRYSAATETAPELYYARIPCQTRSYEVSGVVWHSGEPRLSEQLFSSIRDASIDVNTGSFKPYEWQREGTDAGIARRIIEWTRTYFRSDTDPGLIDPVGHLDHRLPLAGIESLALPYEKYRAAFSSSMLQQIFGDRTAGIDVATEGGYHPHSNHPTSEGDEASRDWWIPSGRQGFDPAKFFEVSHSQDPFGNITTTQSDVYALLLERVRDALPVPLTNVVSTRNDYRVLQPFELTDANRNRSQVAFDALGLVVGTALMGKASDPIPVGDSLNGFVADLPAAVLTAHIDDPLNVDSENDTETHNILRHATTRVVYDFHRFVETGEAPVVYTLARETHVSDEHGTPSKVQHAFTYSDGFGREIQRKIQAEPGPVPQRGDDGRIVPERDGQPQFTANAITPRWVGSGWTVFNNKGKPVRQYEPFFTDTHRFEFDVRIGVSPVLFYDSAERVVATLHPNHTYEKVVFDAWQQTNSDVNDTCAPRNLQTGDPRTDPDIGGYVAEYFKTQPVTWQTWHAQRIGGALGTDEQKAAERAAAHADTPTTAHFDALGRPFLTVARNRVICTGHPLNAMPEEEFRTRIELDIEGNQCKVFDERKLPDAANLPLGALEQRIVLRYAWDMLGNRIHQESQEAGERWMLNDVAGKPVRGWDSRGHNFITVYDALRRPLEQFVRGTFTDPDPLKPNSDPRTLNRDILIDKIEYGEGIANAEALNLRTRIYRHFDSAGAATSARLDATSNPLEAYDFKGNLLSSTRQLVRDYKAIPDWLLNPQLDAEAFEGSTSYDALNRPIQSVAPHSSVIRPGHPNKFNVIQPVFNEANLLKRVDVWLERAAGPVALLDPAVDAPSRVGVANIDYDANGQRLRIDYKNDASTFYRYNPLTFRLTHLLTRRNGAAFPGDDPQPPIVGWPGKQVQNLSYTYDPAGNITHIRDDAQQTIYFSNQRVEPSNDYVYDALYRLIQSDGREHLGQLASSERLPPTAPDGFNAFHTRLDHPGNGQAMGTYTERYVYDAVGNLLQMQHRGSDPAHVGWTRAYTYAEASLIEPGKQSNRLSRTTIDPAGTMPQPETYLHDAHGSMLRMPHLGSGGAEPNMHWDYKDQLRQVDKGGGGAAYYIYDASGQRVRKVWEKAPGLTEERIYLGGFEIFRRHGGAIGANTTTLERETLHLMDDKQRIALVETRTAGNELSVPQQLIRYQFSNHLGSTSLELDDQAEIISYEEFTPYGSTSYQAVHTGTDVLSKRYRFTGNERDEESGLNYHGVRYYATWIGQWTSTDPMCVRSSNWVQQSWFEYACSNPVRFIDPSGMRGVPTDGEVDANYHCMTPGRFLVWSDSHHLTQKQIDKYVSPLRGTLTKEAERSQRDYENTLIMDGEGRVGTRGGLAKAAAVRRFTEELNALTSSPLSATVYGLTGNPRLGQALEGVVLSVGAAAREKATTPASTEAIAELRTPRSGQLQWGAPTYTVPPPARSASPPPRLTIETLGEGALYSESEIFAARWLYENNFGNVTLRQPRGTRSEGRTSDLLVNGTRWDVLTPEPNPRTGRSRQIENIIVSIVKKNDQVRGGGVVVDLRRTDFQPREFGDVLTKVRESGATDIHDVTIIWGQPH